MAAEYPLMLFPGGKPDAQHYRIVADADAERVAAADGFVRTGAEPAKPRLKPGPKPKTPEA